MSDFILGENAKKQMAERGMDEKIVRSQLKVLNGAPPSVHLDRPCATGDGIERMSAGLLRYYSELYEKQTDFVPSAFIPASGAASRMFSSLISRDRKSVESFVKNIKSFAFFEELKKVSNKPEGGIEIAASLREYDEIVNLVLSPEGLGYGDIPKGLVKFHRYGNVSKTAFEEHVEFTGLYARGADGICRVHFTVPQKFSGKIKRRLDAAAHRAGNADVSFSFQNPATDTVAADARGNLLADERGQTVFRPAGHGALLDNLARIGTDIVFISNIDNIPHRRIAENPAAARKALAGLLVETKRKICAVLRGLRDGKTDQNMLSEALSLCARFGFSPPQNGGTNPGHVSEFIRKSLDRPLRVCGVIKNTAEPGGAPFWAKDSIGRISPQIVESVQVDSEDEGQKSVWRMSTHFNPVDIVCSMKNCYGKKFNLRDYCDDVFMVAEKKFEGRRIRALEMPGLWNGAMSGWNTVFAEIASENFHPVKNVFDLLRDSHQDLESEKSGK